MAAVTPTVWYANFGNGSSTGYFAIPVWHTSWTPTVGTITRQTAPTVANTRCFICTTSGAVGATEPTWVVTAGAKTTDGSAVWFECTGHPGLNGDLTSTPLSSQNRSAAQAVGNIIANNTQDHYFICTVTGSTGASEPTYNTTLGATTTDSTCTWTCIGTVASFTAWAAPFARITNWPSLHSGSTLTLYVSSAHQETASATQTWSYGSLTTSPPSQVICISNTPSQLPPAASDITTGATVTFSAGSLSVSSVSCIEYNGLTFANTSGSVSFGAINGTFIRLRNCAITYAGNTSTAKVALAGAVEFINTPITFGSNSSQGISTSSTQFIWRDTPSALAATTWPTTLFPNTNTNVVALIEGVDLSAFAGTAYVQPLSGSVAYTQRWVFSRCKLANVPWFSTGALDLSCTLDAIDCDTGGNTYNTQRYSYGAIQAMSTQVVATSGASDGTIAYSWSLTGTSGNTLSWSSAFECMPIYVWNSVTGTNRTVTIQAAYVGTTLPTNAQIWLDVRYFGTASSTLASVASAGTPTILTTGSAWSSSGATTWGSAAPARLSSNAYTLGNVIGVSSSGSVTRAFVCTTAGTSSGSLPGAYASAGDGTAVTDGTATFTSVNPFVLTVTLSSPQPAEAGYFICYVKCASSNSSSYPTFFVDPLATLS